MPIRFRKKVKSQRQIFNDRCNSALSAMHTDQKYGFLLNGT